MVHPRLCVQGQLDWAGKFQCAVDSEHAEKLKESVIRQPLIPNQLHFHTPSEHTINGEHFDMEMHVVHEAGGGHLKCEEKDLSNIGVENCLSVRAVLFTTDPLKKKDGSAWDGEHEFLHLW